jgi:putative transposase
MKVKDRDPKHPQRPAKPKGQQYTYRTIPLEWRDPEKWPLVSVAHLDEEARARFDRLAKAIRTYLTNGALSLAADEGDCSKQLVLKKVNRCLQLTSEGIIVGWRGLLSHERLAETYKRVDLPQGEHAARKGASGAFERFLAANEGIRERLHAAIRSGGAPKGTKSRNPTLRSVYSQFKKACEDAGLTKDDYPFNSRSGGRRSVERYAIAFIKGDPESVETWYGRDARDQMHLGTGHKGFSFALAPLDLVGADAHEMHCYGVVVVQGPAGPQRVPIERIWVFPVLDKGSRCALRYSVSISTEISGATVEEALVACSTPWKPRQLIAQGLTYAPGAGFPVGTIEGLEECRFSALQIDNAAAHYANRVAQSARRALGCAVTFGPVGAWWRNAFTERFFKTLELYGFQCLPSSSGSNSQDVRKKKPVHNAIRDEITWEELLDLVDVLLANYNATIHESLGGRTPLEVMRTGLSERFASYVPRPAVPVTVHTPALGVSVEVRPIAGSSKRGSVIPPYVQIDRVRYTSPTFSSRWELIGKNIVVHIREADMQVRAFLENGEDLGVLVCMSPGWAAHPHSRVMRKIVNALIRNGELPGIDPIHEYMAYLAKKTASEARRNPTQVSHTGTRLAEAARQTGLGVPSAPARSTFTSLPPRPIPGHIKRPDWRHP